jgi:hypothetical protein
LSALGDDTICLEDIAHALAHLCRFNGHCREFYSVAQHSVLVMNEIGRRGVVLDASPDSVLAAKRAALLHDASEAYLPDVARRLKEVFHLLRMAHEAAQLNIYEYFRVCVSEEVQQTIKHCDAVLLATEARDLMEPPPVPWEALPEPCVETIQPWGPSTAKALFLAAAERIGLIDTATTTEAE